MRRLPPVRRFLRKAVLNKVVEHRRSQRRECRYRWSVRLEDLRDQTCLRLRLERASAGCHLVKDRAERKNVTTRIRWRALHLLRGHVLQRADDRALCGARLRDGGQHRESLPDRADGVLGQAEIEQLRARRRKHDVRGLQIAVDDAVSVCRLEGIRYLDPEAEYLRERERPARDTPVQRLTFEELEYQVF